ncbi:hypothetical protein M9434_001877 [Picochlorum sp. BPE23]|nr:hypothetical protein M9434_001877 [Picochlorum sp. BPE23]
MVHSFPEKSKNVIDYEGGWNPFCIYHGRKGTKGRAQSAMTAYQSNTADSTATSSSIGDIQYPSSWYNADGRLMIKNLSKEELVAWCQSIGEDEKRAYQLWRWMYSDGCWLQNIDDAPAEHVQNGFGKSFREKFHSMATLDGGLELAESVTASDGTVKLGFRVTHGSAVGSTIETVLIPVVREHGSKERITLCVSSQIGCNMGCKFCFTGTMGLWGNLTPGQIVEQAVAAKRYYYQEHQALSVTNVVYMGLGEPFDNLEAVMASIETLLDHHGLHFSHNKVTVSTVGLIPEMKRFLETSKASLAVSLHGATDEVRSSIVPVNKRYPLKDVVSTLKDYFPEGEKKASHVLIEYTMMEGVNDSPEQAEELLKVLEGVKCKINLIVFNPHEGTVYRESPKENVDTFRDILIRGGRVVTVRQSRGEDSMAACGQLGEGKGKRMR